MVRNCSGVGLETCIDGIPTGSGAVIRNYQELLVLVGGCQKNQLQVGKIMKRRQQWIKTTRNQRDQQLTTAIGHDPGLNSSASLLQHVCSYNGAKLFRGRLRASSDGVSADSEAVLRD
ncbi:hypothetical protein QAD02_021593 [Eretmocerus hayati]|uniref:Uncharacterized protein n=1 Tax=Eretmocerus hayati TaxID=131215 RepID=A0ACC2PVI7_9HYME|nr:hypothetical protein QAD02_021593 [Eretmocerus hayati]